MRARTRTGAKISKIGQQLSPRLREARPGALTPVAVVPAQELSFGAQTEREVN